MQIASEQHELHGIPFAASGSGLLGFSPTECSALFCSALFYWLEVRPLSEKEVRSLDTVMSKFARSLLQGTAHTQIDGKRRALANVQVLARFGVAPAKIELQCRRACFWLGCIRSHTKFEQLWAALLGNASNLLPQLTSAGHISPHATPMFKVLMADIVDINAFEGLEELHHIVQNQPLNLLSPEAVNLLADRRMCQTSEKHGLQSLFHRRGRRTCMKMFSQMAVHQTITKAGNHVLHYIHKLAHSSTRPVCRKTFSTTRGARKRLCRSVERGHCVSAGLQDAYPRIVEKDLVCHVCHGAASRDWEVLCDHSRFHLPAIYIGFKRRRRRGLCGVAVIIAPRCSPP